MAQEGSGAQISEGRFGNGFKLEWVVAGYTRVSNHCLDAVYRILSYASLRYRKLH